MGDVAAHGLGVDVGGREAAIAGPPRELTDVERVRVARAWRGVAPAQVELEQRARLSPGTARAHLLHGRHPLLSWDAHLILYFATRDAAPACAALYTGGAGETASETRGLSVGSA